jgi:hypothetical protein
MYLTIVFGNCDPLLLGSEFHGEAQLKYWYKQIKFARHDKVPEIELEFKDGDGNVYQKTSINTFAIRYMTLG